MSFRFICYTITLQYKIALGYLILLVVIGSMTAILFYEQNRMNEIDTETFEVRQVRQDINVAHILITELATLGESVIAWDSTDINAYSKQHLRVDRYLAGMKRSCSGFVSPGHIDSLRNILQEKENHLMHIMEILQKKDETDSLFISRFPAIVEKLSKVRTVTRRKKGFSGRVLGRSETVFIPPSYEEVYELKDEMNTLQKGYILRIELYADSLRMQNKFLNQKLTSFMNYLDNHVHDAFKKREEKIADAHDFSSILFSIVVVSAIVLQIISFIVIKSELRREEDGKEKLRQIIEENGHLLNMRKKIILTVSHDIRGPLGNIINCAELASDTRDRRKREIYLENIRYSCRRILHLVNDLMDVYRMNETKDICNDVPFYLDKVMMRISDDYSKKSNKKALVFNSEHKNTNVVVKGDPDKIEQVLNNVLTNAVKFTETGHIDFISEYSDGKLSVKINDTGIGMDGETLTRVFKPFERAAQNINSEGFGLGLSITKGLVDVLNGTMHVESVPGKGTEFHFVFPLEETSETVDSDDVQYVHNSILPKRIIVVDDDALQLKIVEDMLGRNGIVSKTCTNAREVVDALQNSEYDLILTDIQMHGMDGFSLLKFLRNSDIGNSQIIPVAAMTARGDGESGVYVRSGFCGYIHKPFSMKSLLSFLSSVMTDNIQGKKHFDYSLLLDSVEDKKHTLELLIQESGRDMIELKEALNDMNRTAIRQIIHRMLPVWEMLGVRDILDALRSCLHNEETDDEIRNRAIYVMEMIEMLITESEKESGKYGE